jgi:hypothetical protein
MIETLKRHWIPIALFSLVPITSCTLISEVDRGKIDEKRPDASGGASGSGATGGSGGSSGADGTGGTAGTAGAGGSDDGPMSNDDASDDGDTDDAAED